MSAETVNVPKTEWEANQKQVKDLTGQVKSLVDRMKKTPADNPERVFGVPYARTGEDTMGSRGYSFLKMMGLIAGFTDPRDAKIELDISNRMAGLLDGSGYEYKGIGTNGKNRLLAPLGTSYLPENLIPADFRHEMKSLVMAGTDGASVYEQQHICTKMLNSGNPSVRAKALSWLNELEGGALVAPPEQGELIELLRNKEALVNAGARTVPLPPQGRMKFPRQTSASSTYWVGENTSITESEIGTGEVTLQGKKLAVLIKSPNELIRFASPAAEALLRDDMTKSLALGLDLAGLEGQGSDTRPRGIINMPNINTVTSSTTGANGDTLEGQDVYRMIAAVEESNAEFEGWIMRPKTYYRYQQLRADAVAQDDSAGLFLFSLTRSAGEGFGKPMLADYPVTKSTQVSQVRVKGSGSNLTYVVGGMWSDLLIGMFGAIEFASSTHGDAFVQDQTWIRGILTADIAARHEAAFAFMDNLVVTG